jgi:L-threonylcarbamoyladenylate synthase
MNNKNRKKTIEEFIKELNKGKVCLHPTDTVPGLTFNPKSLDKIYELKNQRENKKFVRLVYSLSMAKENWKPLPPLWEKALEKLWPGPLTVIWKAKNKNPFTNPEGYTALRYPHLKEEDSWLYDIINEISNPLPSTSVNKSSEPPIKNWEQAKKFCITNSIFIPKLEQYKNNINDKPSTIIKIFADNTFTILREGHFSKEEIEKCLEY